MAEGLLRHDAGNRFEVFSAGTKSRVKFARKPSPSCANWASTFPAIVQKAWTSSPPNRSTMY
jgi:protein-tyrosine-phosphatase